MKTPRLSAPSTEFGLIAWLENTRVALPLKGVECRFQVTGAIACVELDQIYQQNTDRPLDCTYTFPLPAGAAVYRCELLVNGRMIRAKVEEKEAARRIYREQKAEGRLAALVESERENLFTLSIGNVQPGDVTVVRFAWFHVLDRVGDGLRLLVPTCPGVRYIPGKPLLRGLSGRGTADDTDQVPDASRITPPRIDALHPDAAYFSLEGRLSSSDIESGTASSPSHPIFVRESEGAVAVELSDRDTIPDRDFVLAWREPKSRQLAPQAWRWVERDEAYLLVQLRAPEGVKVAEGFAQDFYFLLDRSGSMSGAKWQRTCDALRAFVSLLGPDDRVWITLFESDYRDFAEAPIPASAVLADRGFQRMEGLGTGGGTQLLPAAVHVLEQISLHSAGGRANVVLITDGQVGNDGEVMRAFRQTPRVRVHTFGIDTAVNDAFLKSLARQQRGGCWLQTPDDDIAGTIAALGDRLRRPVLTDLSVRGSWEPAREAWPDLHAGECVTVPLRGVPGSPIEIMGRLPDGRDHCFAVNLDPAGNEAAKLLWAKERIAALLESGRRDEAIAVAKQHNLICDGAAFIAWDEAEHVQIAKEEIIQPALELHFKRSATRSCFKAPCSSSRIDDDPAFKYRAVPRAEAALYFEDASRVPAASAQLRDAFQRAGVPEPTLEAFVAWAQSRDGEALQRLRTLQEAAGLIAQIRNQLDSPIVRDLWERHIRQALSISPEALLRWADESLEALNQITAVQRNLSASETPSEVVDCLVAWVLESGSFDRLRLEELKAFTESLDHVPFSAGSKARHWRAFLDSTVGANSGVYAVASRWCSEEETHGEKASVRASV